MTAQVAANAVDKNLRDGTTAAITPPTNLGTVVNIKLLHGKNKYNIEIGLDNTG